MTFFDTICYSLDMFKSPVYLLINGNRKISTKNGTFYSILIIITLIILFYKSKLIQKTSPFIFSRTIPKETRDLIELKEDFVLGLGLIDDSGNIYNDPSYFQFYINYVGADLDNNSFNLNSFLLRNCTEEDFPNSQFSLLKFLNKTQLTCLQNQVLNIYGHPSDSVAFQALAITLSTCNYTNQNNSCRSEQELIEFLKNKNFKVIYYEKSFDLNNYEHPISKNLKIESFTPTMDYITQREIYFRKSTLIQDDGLITSNHKNLTGYLKNDIKQFSIGYDRIVLISCLFYVSEYEDISYRNYQKLTEALGELGGNLNILIIIFSFVASLNIEVSFLNLYFKYFKIRYNNDLNQVNNLEKKKNIDKNFKNYEFDENYNENKKNFEIPLFKIEMNLKEKYFKNKNFEDENILYKSNNNIKNIETDKKIEAKLDKEEKIKKNNSQKFDNLEEKINKNDSQKFANLIGNSYKIKEECNEKNKDNINSSKVKREKSINNNELIEINNNKENENFTINSFHYFIFKLKEIFKLKLLLKEKFYKILIQNMWNDIDLFTIILKTKTNKFNFKNKKYDTIL